MVKANYKLSSKKKSNYKTIKNLSLESKHIKDDLKFTKIIKETNNHKKTGIKKNDILKKNKIELNSKLKKKIKLTKKLLKLDSEKVQNAILYIKKQNEEISEKFGKQFFNNFYAYIILKNKITEEIDSFKEQEFKEKTKKYSKFEIEKVGDLNDPLVNEANKHKIKNFFFKLPVDFTDEENKLKILLVNSGTENSNKIKTEENKNKKQIKDKDEESYKLVEKLMEVKYKDQQVSEKQKEQFISLFENKIDIKGLDEFINMVKSTKNKLNLNYLYKNFICDEKLKSRLNNISLSNKANNVEKGSKNKFFNSFDDIIDVQFLNYGNKEQKNMENIIISLDLSQRRSIVKNLNNKIFKIKFSNTSNNDDEIKRNFENLSINLTSFLLSKSNKFNNVKTIVMKSENSIPITIYGELDVEEYEYFKL